MADLIPKRTADAPGTPVSSPQRRVSSGEGKGRGPLIAGLIGTTLLAFIIWGILAFRSRPAAPSTSAQSPSSTGKPALAAGTPRPLRIHGTVEALDYRSVSAPRLSGPGGNQMIITRLLSTGAKVKKGDIVVEFDRQNQEKNALDRQADFRDFEEQIKKKRADNLAAEARDVTDLKAAENAVETASLEMKKNEIVSRIDAEKNAQNLEEARANLAQLKETLELKRVARSADRRILEIQRDRARNAMNYARHNMERLSIRSPIEGMVVLQPVWMQSSMRDVQEGDDVRPGNAFMQVVNPAGMQVRAKVNQADIGSLEVGQEVKVRLDAYPDLVLPGKLSHLAAIGVTSMLNQKVRSFTAVFSITGSDPRLLPDLSAAVELVPRGGAPGRTDQAQNKERDLKPQLSAEKR